jgi:glucose-1-phosphate thymidylyltransferase
MLAGIRDILIITTPQDKGSYKRLLGDGKRYGVRFKYATQERPEGLAQAFIIGENFIGKAKCALILGDNVFHGTNLGTQLSKINNVDGAQIFAYQVKDPERYGVVEFDSAHSVISIEEKPRTPKSAYAVPGLYFYDEEVVQIAKSIKPSMRGELEITDVNQEYLRRGKLQATILDRGTAWLDTGTFETLIAASVYIQVLEERQGQKISCLEEIAWRNNWISDSDILFLSNDYGHSPFGEYLSSLVRQNEDRR